MFMPEKQQRNTLIYESRKAPDAHSELHKKQETWTEQCKISLIFFFLPTTQNEHYLSTGGDRVADRLLCQVWPSKLNMAFMIISGSKAPHLLHKLSPNPSQR